MKIQQLVIIKTSALNGSAYCMSHNVPLGRKIGLSEAQIAAAKGDDYMARPRSTAPEGGDPLGGGGHRMTARDDDAHSRR